MNKNLLLFLFSAAVLISSCNEKGNGKSSTNMLSAGTDILLQRLKTVTFYEDSTSDYRKYFFTQYDAAIRDQKFEEAKNMICAYGYVASFVYDSVLNKTAEDFIYKDYPMRRDSQYAMVCHYVAWSYFFRDDMTNAKSWAERAISACNFSNPEPTLRFAYHDLAGAYVNTNEVDSAIVYFLKTLDINERLKDSIQLASAYFNLGSCYYALYAYNECGKYVSKAIEMDRALKDTGEWLHDEAFFPLNNDVMKLDTAEAVKRIDYILGNYRSYSKQNLTDSFLTHILTAKKYILQKKNAAATSELDQCEKLNAQQVDYILTSYLDDLNNQNEVALTGHLKHPEEFKKQAAELVGQDKFFDAVNLYTLLSQSAANTGNVQEFIDMKRMETSLKDSIYARNVKGQIFELDKKYQVEKKQQQIALQEKTIQAKTRSIGFLIASLIGLVLITMVLYLVQRQAKLKQEKQNSMQFTKQLFSKTEEERKRIATDLHDSISHELMNLKSATREEFETVHSRIDVIINDIRIISRNLHPVLFERIGLTGTIEQMVERVQQQNDFLLTSDINYSNSLSSANELQVYRIIQEAITNIVKYAGAIAGKVTINEDANAVHIEIKDNGRGFNVPEVMNSGKAFGLHNIIERSRAAGGEAKITSGKGGTVIKIDISKQQS